MRDIPPGFTRWGGYPPQELSQEMRLKSITRRELPRLKLFFKALKKAGSLEELKAMFFKPEE